MGSAVEYGMDPLGFFDRCREKVGYMKFKTTPDNLTPFSVRERVHLRSTRSPYDRRSWAQRQQSHPWR